MVNHLLHYTSFPRHSTLRQNPEKKRAVFQRRIVKICAAGAVMSLEADIYGLKELLRKDNNPI
jgi:hypothetical protein